MVGFLELRRQCGVSHEVRQGAQGASLMAPGKSGLHVCGERVRVISIEPWKQIRASRHVEVGLSRSFSHCGRKPWVPSTCAGDLMELLRVPLRSQGYHAGKIQKITAHVKAEQKKNTSPWIPGVTGHRDAVSLAAWTGFRMWVHTPHGLKSGLKNSRENTAPESSK